MAKIRKVECYTSEKTYESHLEYYSTDARRGHRTEKFFYVRLEEDMKIIFDSPDKKVEGLLKQFWNRGTNYWVAYAASESDAIENWKTVIKFFVSETSKKQKVILYQVDYSSKTKTSSSPDRSYHSSGLTEEAKIDFNYIVAEKRTFAGAVNYYAKNDEGKVEQRTNANGVGNNITDNNWVELPYSKDTEQFFESIYKAMEALMQKFNDHLGTKKSILKTLESKIKLLS